MDEKTKRLQLIDWIKRNIKREKNTFVDGSLECLEQRLEKFDLSKLEDIVTFIQKGHRLDPLCSNKPYNIPDSYFRLLNQLDNIELYPFLELGYVFQEDMCNELETVLIGGYDDFMYQEYAIYISNKLRKLLYKSLIQGVNLTHDMQYSNHKSEGINYVNAVMRGNDKNLSFYILKHFNTDQYDELKRLLSKGITMNDIYNKFNNKEIKTSETLFKYVNDCERYEYDIKDYFNYLNDYTAQMSETFFTIIKATNENLIPNGTSELNIYEEYIRYIGGSDILDWSSQWCELSFELLILIEIHLKLGINIEPYIEHVDNLLWQALFAIANGENLLPYLTMGVEEPLLDIYRSYYKKYENVNMDYILGFVILRQVCGEYM